MFLTFDVDVNALMLDFDCSNPQNRLFSSRNQGNKILTFLSVLVEKNRI